MRIRAAGAALLALALGTISCSEGILTPAAPGAPQLSLAAASLPEVRISEFHYDNVGGDVDEKIEISGPTGFDLTGWSIVLYNGSATQRSTYATLSLSGKTIPATCGARGVVVVNATGLQNGSSTATGIDPDGIALVNGTTVVEFISYEGSFIAANGPAAGQQSVDIGVREGTSEPTTPTVTSLKRDGNGVWQAPSPHNFDACNDDQTTVAEVASVTVTPVSVTLPQGAKSDPLAAAAFDAGGAPVPGTTFAWTSGNESIATVDAGGVVTGVAMGEATITATAANGKAGSAVVTVTEALPPPAEGNAFISEIHYDNDGADLNEGVEIEGPAGLSLAGWSLVLYNGNGGAPYGSPIALSGVIQGTCGDRGVLRFDVPGIQNGHPDGIALLNGTTVVEFISYGGAFTAVGGPANGRLAEDVGVRESNTTPAGRSLQRALNGEWFGPRTATFGACNPATPPAPTFGISFTGRTPTDSPLPVGFQDQIFATLRDDNGATVTTTFAWSAVTANVAVDQDGVITALGAGDATIRATAADGVTTATYTLPFAVASASSTARYEGNAEFGEPKDADASDDFIVRHDQFTASYSKVRNTPNWVSYNLDPTHFGSEDRCDCFTFDPSVPAEYARYTTADYTGAGAFHGYGIDRGHLARSFDRTSGSFDNATTFYFSNIIPQAADLNQGPWAVMESHLGDLARQQGREVYIVTGVAGSKGTLKNEGLVTIPEAVWKVAVVMPHDAGLEDVGSWRDLEVIAVVMPNVAGVRNNDWNGYRTTVDAVEALSGYDLLALLPDQVEIAVESGTKPPSAVLDGPYTSTEGAAVGMSAAGSSDPDGDALGYAWSFGDGTTATGAAVSHRYAQDGSYTVTLTVTDALGLTATVTTTATVANVPPTVSALAGASLLPGETYTGGGTFTDPGADSWSATVDYGDGSPIQALALRDGSFTLSHRYTVAGAHTVTVTITDDDNSSLRMATIVVMTPAQGVGKAITLVDASAASGELNAGQATSLRAKLDAARRSLDAGNETAAAGPLGAALAELEALVRAGRLTAADAGPLTTLLERVLGSLAAIS